jgi:hypothetical protein
MFSVAFFQTSNRAVSTACIALLGMACGLPSIAAAQASAVASFPSAGVDGNPRTVYFKATRSTLAAAMDDAMAACNVERRNARAGSVIPDRSRCEPSTVADFEIARRSSSDAQSVGVVVPDQGRAR